MCFFIVKHTIVFIWGIVSPIDMKENKNALLGELCDHDLDLYLGFFKVKFEIAASQE